VSGRCQEGLDHAIVSVRLGIRLESTDLLGGRWESDEVEVDPPNPCLAGRLRVGLEAGTLQSIEDESVDRVLGPTGPLRIWDDLGLRRLE
jgi:hypothetical protein